MSEHNAEVWADLERLSRRMARIEIALTERILTLEAEVAALKAGKPETLQQRIDRETAQEMSHEEYQKLITEIMQR